MRPANPASWWVNGSETANFTYTPGSTPFYVVMRKSGHIPASILIWADDEKGVWSVLWDMINFARAVMAQYIPHDSRLTDIQDGRKKKIQELEDCLNGNPCEYELTITPFVPNHPIKVSWASNDYVF